jgi:ABC-type glycerol-3-phosphate transport system substrate-binding protein
LVSTPTSSPVGLVLWENLPPNQVDQLKADLIAFQQQFPQIIIQTQHYDTVETLAAAINADRVDYDLILGPGTLLSPLQQAGKLQPMENFFPPSFLDGFSSPTLVGATHAQKIWGLPDSAGFHLLLFYNLNLVEQPPTTITDLSKQALSLQEGTVWGLGVNSYDPVWLLPWLWAYGGWLVDSDGRPTLNSPAMVQALTLHLSWQQGQTAIAPLQDYQGVQQQFFNGQLAMIIDGEWLIGALQQNANMPWGVSLLPAIPAAEQGPGPLILARYWAIGNQTTGAKAEAAAAVLDFMTRPERQLAWAKTFGGLPTRRAALIDPQIVTDPVMRINAQQLQNGRGVPLGVNLNAILDAMRQPLAQMLLGDLTPTEAAQQMQQQATTP